MTIQSVDARSTKAQIIESASEVIASQDNQLQANSMLLTALKEEKQALTYLLIATSSIALLF